jgi:multidrug resistance efflux pump
MKPSTSLLRGWRGPLLVAVAGTLLIASSLQIRQAARARSVSEPTAAPASTAPAGEGVVCFGVVDLDEGVTSLAPVQPGRVAEVLVRENQKVRRGTELLRLDDEAPRGQLAEADAGVGLARFQLEQARKLPESRREQVARQESVLKAASTRLAAARQIRDQRQRLGQPANIAAVDSAASELEIRELEALEQAEAQKLAELRGQDLDAGIRRAEFELAAAEARRDQAKAALEGCRLRAPRDGTILRINTGAGEVLGGVRSLPVVLFAADGPRVIRATVEQEFAGRIKEGDRAIIEDETDGSTTWRGKVERIADWYSQRRTVLHDPSQLTDVRTLECVVVLEPGQSSLRLGQTVRVLMGRVPSD